MVAKQLLLNLSLLLVLLFFFQLWHDRKSVPITLRGLQLYFFCSLFVCFVLSSPITNELVFDLRQIPLILIGLYAGFFSSLLLLAFTLLIRGVFFGVDLGFWYTALSFTMIMISTGLLHRVFVRLNSFKKFIMTMSFSTIITTIWVWLHFYEQYVMNFDLWISYLVIPTIGMLIITYTIEKTMKNYYLKEKLINSEKMEAISQLSASISHEVRNPLTAIRGFLQLIKEPGYTEERRNEFVQIAIDELDRAETIISDYLAFAKPEEDEVGYIDVQDVLKRVVKVLTPLANMNSVEMRLNLTEQCQVYGDRNKFHQSIMNIVKNAIEATTDGGTIHIDCSTNTNHVIIVIKDNGVGMTSQQVKQLGQPYFSTKGSKGTGLGMMVTYSVVRGMKGNIEVKSKKNSGTTFKLKFKK